MKKKKGILTVLLCVFFLWGCQSFGEQIKEPEIELQEQAGQQNSEEEEETVISADSGEVDRLPKIPEGEILGLQKQQTGLYHYERLNDEEKTLYTEILKILLDFREGVSVSCMEPEQIEKVFQCV